ncbi:MAG: PAS domain-containing protein, partial [Verrucomicrobiota bacterium]
MNASPTGHAPNRKRALVVQHDPGTRKLICEQLTNFGFEVDAGGTVAEGAARYKAQPLVVTSTDRDPMIPRGFIAWLHENHPDENSRPYILAVCDRESSLSTPPQNRAWDELLTLPVKGSELKHRIQAIGTWVDRFLASRENGNGSHAPQIDAGIGATAVPVAEPQDRERIVVRAKFPNRRAQTVEAAPQQRLADVTTSQAGSEFTGDPGVKVPPPPSLVSPKTAPVKPITPPTGPVAERTRARPMMRNTGLMSPTEQFQALVDNAPVALAMLDQDLRYLVANRRWLRDFRLENVEVIGQSHLEIFPQLAETWSHVYFRALEGMPDRSQPEIFVHADGSQSWVRWEVQPWTNSAREIQGITISCEAVNQDPNANSPSELELVGHSLLKGKVTPVISLTMEGMIEEASEACLGFVPTSTTSLRGQHFWELFVSDQRRDDMRLQFLAAAKETRENEYFAFPPTFVTEVRLSSGGDTTMAWTNSPRYDGTGRISGVVCLGIPIGDGSALLNDIDKARKGRQNLSGAASYYATEPSAILEQISFGIVLLDPERNTLYANPEHRHLLGYDVETFDD